MSLCQGVHRQTPVYPMAIFVFYLVSIVCEYTDNQLLILANHAHLMEDNHHPKTASTIEPSTLSFYAPNSLSFESFSDLSSSSPHRPPTPDHYCSPQQIPFAKIKPTMTGKRLESLISLTMLTLFSKSSDRLANIHQRPRLARSLFRNGRFVRRFISPFFSFQIQITPNCVSRDMPSPSSTDNGEFTSIVIPYSHGILSHAHNAIDLAENFALCSRRTSSLNIYIFDGHLYPPTTRYSPDRGTASVAGERCEGLIKPCEHIPAFNIAHFVALTFMCDARKARVRDDIGFVVQ